MPELYREAGLHRMEPYFWALRSALIQSAQGDLADPRVVVLSPGTQSETAYDQAFVASALGFPLVLGSDLVVRDGWVYMKSPSFSGASRLERVDVILRRVDAAWSDPLELRGDSQLGVAGLVEAVRRGRVRVVNGLGAGVLENPGLMPFLPAACEALLGEPLRLGSVPTWWCGEADGLDHVLDRVGEITVRPIDGPTDALAGLSVDELRVAGARGAVPLRRPGVAPALAVADLVLVGRPAGTVDAAHLHAPLRLGLPAARRRTGQHPRRVRTAAVDGEQGRVGPQGRPRRRRPGPVRRAADDGGPLDADDRAARARGHVLVRAVRRAGRGPAPAGARRARARRGLPDPAAVDRRRQPRGADGRPAPDGRPAGRRPDRPGRRLPVGAARPGPAGGASPTGSTACATRSAASATSSRPTCGVPSAPPTAPARCCGPTRTATRSPRAPAGCSTGILSLQGVTASMIRDPGWHAIGVGRSLERSLQVCHLLAATTTERRGIDVDREVLNAVLTAAESAVTHRRRYRGYVRPAGVLELLLMDPDNPRSVAFSLAEARVHLAGLPGLDRVVAARAAARRPDRRADRRRRRRPGHHRWCRPAQPGPLPRRVPRSARAGSPTRSPRCTSPADRRRGRSARIGLAMVQEQHP